MGWVLERSNDAVWTGLVGLRVEIVGEHFECGNKLSGSIKCWEIIEWLHSWRPLG
jgi:hypothetical protein